MEVHEILSHIDRNQGYFPKAAVQQAVARHDEIVPALLEVLEDVARDPRPYASHRNRAIHIYAMLLLAQFRETRAYPPLLEIFSAPGEVAIDLIGDGVFDFLGRTLASVSYWGIGIMTSLVEDGHANRYIRTAAMDALLALVASGERSRDEVMARFRSLFHKLERAPNSVWTDLVHACAELYPEEAVAEIRQAYEENLVDPSSVGWSDIEYQLAAGKEAAMERLKVRYPPITDVEAEIGGWACFRENTGEAGRREVRPSPHPFQFGMQKPVRRTQPKVGRNDPCPCGSRKKFKKCCGR